VLGDATGLNNVNTQNSGPLLIVGDNSTKLDFLIDTGSVVSVVPPTKQEKLCETESNLKASCQWFFNFCLWGKKLLTVDLGLRRNFSFPSIIADVTKPLIGINF